MTGSQGSGATDPMMAWWEVLSDKQRVREPEQRLQQAIAAIGTQMSAQLAEILHHPRFLRLEGTWRGLGYLAIGRETGALLKVRMLHATKHELAADFAANALEDISLYQKLYEYEFAVVG